MFTADINNIILLRYFVQHQSEFLFHSICVFGTDHLIADSPVIFAYLYVPGDCLKV